MTLKLFVRKSISSVVLSGMVYFTESKTCKAKQMKITKAIDIHKQIISQNLSNHLDQRV